MSKVKLGWELVRFTMVFMGLVAFALMSERLTNKPDHLLDFARFFLAMLISFCVGIFAKIQVDRLDG